MENSYLKNVMFSDMTKWYVELYINRKNINSKYPLIALGKLIMPSGVVLDKNNYDTTIPIVDKIRFVDGKIFFRKKNETNMNIYYSYSGDLIVSKINFHQGAVAINDFGQIACTTHYQPYKINSGLVDSMYLLLVLRSDYFKNYISSIKAKGIKNESGYSFIKAIKIPVPSIEEQHEIVARYNANMLRIELIKDEYSYWQIERFIENYLELKNVNTHNNQGILNFSYYTDLLTWDVRNRTNQQVFETSRYKLRSLKTLAEVNPALTKKLNDNEDVSFVPMECVSDLDGVINEYRTCKAGRKGFTKFENRDIIWAKITPCMQNGKSAVVNNLKNGIGYGSTEFYVIRPNKAIILPEYLHYLLRMYRVREEAVNYFSGSAGQQRVRRSFLENLNIPVPSIEEQKYLVSKLDELKLKIIKNRETIQNLQNQAQSDFESAIFEV